MRRSLRTKPRELVETRCVVDNRSFIVFTMLTVDADKGLIIGTIFPAEVDGRKVSAIYTAATRDGEINPHAAGQ